MINITGNNWEIDEINTVLFDKDGTFLNDNIYWGKLAELRIYKIIEHFNLDKKISNELCFAIGYNPNECKLIKNGVIGTLSRNEVINFTVNEIKKYGVSSNFETISNIFDKVHTEFSKNIEKYLEMIEYSKDFILQLKSKNIKLAVVTSDTYEHTLKILKILGLNDAFDCVIGKDSCKKDKKTGEPALEALKQLNSNIQNTVAIGDAVMDYEMSKNAGLKSEILVGTGQTDIEILKKYSNHVVNNLSEVKIR